MADEADGIEEVFEHSTRVALTAGGLMAERIMRAREQQHREAQAASEQEAREVQQRLDSERAAARSSLAPVSRDEWWESASPEDIGDAWQTANAWRDIDPDAQRTADEMRDQLRSRYDVDVDSLGADPGAVREALERRDGAHELATDAREQARQEQRTAQLLTRDADRADNDREPDEAGLDHERAEEHRDTAERRKDMAAELEGVADEETIEARVIADTNEGRPAKEAVSNGPRRTPTARRGRGKGTQTRQPRRSERGR